MNVYVYHEVRPEHTDKVLREGLQCRDSGEKSDGASEKADAFLDERVPAELAGKGVGRQCVVYGYLAADGKLVDIRSGEPVAIDDFAADRELTLIRMSVDPARCYVSDLDLFDAVKDRVQHAESDPELDARAHRYWASVVPLGAYRPGQLRRPEVMIVGDVNPEAIEIAAPSS